LTTRRSTRKISKNERKEKSFNPIKDFFLFFGLSEPVAQGMFYISIVIILYLFIGFMAGDWV
jgi:hypothetical protein